MKIGRKIYYEKNTGNIILDTGERTGNVIDTTMQQDFENFSLLSQRTLETVGCIQLEHGKYSDKFGLYYYSINPVTKQIVWGEKINSENLELQPTLEKQFAELKQQNLILMDALATVYEEILSQREGVI